MKIIPLLKDEISWNTLIKALVSLVPIAICYIWMKDPIFWNIGLLTISLVIGAERLKLGSLAISLHFLLILACFTALFFAFLLPYVFVLLCAVLAFATIYFTQHGAKIRTLANYTFIPTVYLTCELHEKIAPALTISTYLKFITLTPIAWLTVLLIYGAPRMLVRLKKLNSINLEKPKKIMGRVLHGADLGKPEEVWMLPAVAIFIGVMVAASLVIFLHISRGEWVIWSVASVITIEFASSKKKFSERILGALIGVPLGFFVAQFVPKTELLYVLAALGIMLTLVAFKRYRFAFTCRCFFVAFAAFIASATPTIAVERIANVLLGGGIGLAAFYIAETIFNRLKTSRA